MRLFGRVLYKYNSANISNFNWTDMFAKNALANLAVPRTQWRLEVDAREDGVSLGAFLSARILWLNSTHLALLLERQHVRVHPAGALLAPKLALTPAAFRIRPRSTVVSSEAPATAANAAVVVPDEPSTERATASPMPGPTGLLPTDLAMPLSARQIVHVTVPCPPGLFDPAQLALEFLLDDGAMLVVNKPAGIPVQPTGEHHLFNIQAALHARLRSSDPTHDVAPHLAHRIDKYTSGVLVTVLDRVLKKRISRLFEEHKVQKQYLAIVHGVPSPPSGVIDAPLLRVDGSARTLVDPLGKNAQTRFAVLESFGAAFSLVQFEPLTGRTHQIRAHATHVGHPLLCDFTYDGGVRFTADQLRQAVNDPQWWQRELPQLREQQRAELAAEEAAFKAAAQSRYAEFITPLGDAPEHSSFDDILKPAYLLQRCALHASRVEFVHPSTGVPVQISAPLAADMDATVAFLREVSETLVN